MITLYSGLVVRQALVEKVVPAFEAASGIHVEATFEPTSVLLQRIASGERPDLVLGVSSAVRALADEDVLDGETITDVAVSSIGFARQPVTAAPGDPSAATFLDYLVRARAVAYSLSGASGLHLMEVLRERGLLERIDERSVRFPSGLTAEAIVDGRADVAVQQVSELRAVPGTHIVMPIPDELQAYARFAIGVRAGAPAAAREFAEMLAGTVAQEALATIGLSAP